MMGRGRPWTETEDEDELIRQAAALTRKHGRFDPDRNYDDGRRTSVDRLGGVAKRIGHSPAAVRKRAQRIDERSYIPWEEWFRRL